MKSSLPGAEPGGSLFHTSVGICAAPPLRSLHLSALCLLRPVELSVVDMQSGSPSFH